MEMAFTMLKVTSCSFPHMNCNIQVIYFMFPSLFIFNTQFLRASLCRCFFGARGVGGGVLEALYSAI